MGVKAKGLVSGYNLHVTDRGKVSQKTEGTRRISRNHGVGIGFL